MKPLTAVHFDSQAQGERPLLVVGPSLGTSVDTLWQECAGSSRGDFTVLGWQLPGHGGAEPDEGFSVADLASAVLALIDSSWPSAPEEAARTLLPGG